MTSPPPDRFAAALAGFDALNAEDPSLVASADGQPVAKELLYAQHMTAWLGRLLPDASEALRLAARAQHLCRWRIPRSDYPDGRLGYRAWRADCAKLHAELASGVLREQGYDEALVARVAALLEKKRLKVDAEAQALEDVACLVFLEHYFAEFAARHDDEKVVGILRKTWIKMSERGRQLALSLPLAERSRRLVERALA
jgi:hypothetical protein